MNNIKHQVWDQAWYQVRDQVSDQVSDQVWIQVWGQVSGVWGQVPDTVRLQMLQVTDRIRGHIRRQVKDQR